MCIVHSTLRDATTPYTERYDQLPTPKKQSLKKALETEGL